MNNNYKNVWFSIENTKQINLFINLTFININIALIRTVTINLILYLVQTKDLTKLQIEISEKKSHESKKKLLIILLMIHNICKKYFKTVK